MQEFERIEFVKEEDGNKLYVNGEQVDISDCKSINIGCTVEDGYFEITAEKRVCFLSNGPLVRKG